LTRLKRAIPHSDLKELDLPGNNFRLAEQLPAATLNIAESVVSEMSSATFLTRWPHSAPIAYNSLSSEKHLATAAILPPYSELEDENRMQSGFTFSLKPNFPCRRPAFSPEP